MRIFRRLEKFKFQTLTKLLLVWGLTGPTTLSLAATQPSCRAASSRSVRKSTGLSKKDFLKEIPKRLTQVAEFESVRVKAELEGFDVWLMGDITHSFLRYIESDLSQPDALKNLLADRFDYNIERFYRSSQRIFLLISGTTAQARDLEVTMNLEFPAYPLPKTKISHRWTVIAKDNLTRFTKDATDLNSALRSLSNFLYNPRLSHFDLIKVSLEAPKQLSSFGYGTKPQRNFLDDLINFPLTKLNAAASSGTRHLVEVAKIFSASDSVVFYNGLERQVLDSHEFQPGSTFGVDLLDGQLLIGKNIPGGTHPTTFDSTSMHLQLSFNHGNTGSKAMGFLGRAGAIRFNADGSIDVSGHHAKDRSTKAQRSEAASAISEFIQNLSPSTTVRWSNRKLKDI